MVIHGGIDGYSRLVVFLKCSNNNRASTVLKAFQNATTCYFIPSRIRTDYGGENIDVARFMLQHRGFHRGSVLTGSSVHNQRIERLWRDVFQRVTGMFYKLFHLMQNMDILDPLNDLHLYCLHLVYIPRIQHALDIFSDAWNHHPIAGMSNQSPVQLFTLGINKLRGSVADDFFTVVSPGYGVDYGGPVSNDIDVERTVEVPPVCVNISDSVKDQLSSIDPLSKTEGMGIELYLKALYYCGCIDLFT